MPESEADLNKTGSGGGDEKPKKAQSLRYPLKRIENKSDYMEIQVIEYEPPTFNLGNNKTDTTNVELANIGTGTESNRKKKAKKYIYLPIPQNLSDTNSITWGDDRLNPLEAFGLSAATGAVQNMEGAQAQAGRFFNAVSSAGSILAKNKDTINATIGAALYNTLGGNVSKYYS